MLKHAKQAVGLIGGHIKGELDYSLKSLSVVEDLVDEASKCMSKAGEKEDKMLVTSFGCYILAIADKMFEGNLKWVSSEKEPIFIVGDDEANIGIMTFVIRI